MTASPALHAKRTYRSKTPGPPGVQGHDIPDGAFDERDAVAARAGTLSVLCLVVSAAPVQVYLDSGTANLAWQITAS